MSFNMGSAFTCPTCTHEKTPYPCIYMHSPGSVVLWWLLLTGVSNFCALPSAPATLSAAAGGAAAAAAFASAADMALKAGEQQACSTQTACSPQDDPVFSLCLPGTSFSPLFTTPETWLRECDKMVMHRCTLISMLCQCVLCRAIFSPGSHLVTTEPVYAYAIRRRSGQMLCMASLEGLLPGGICSGISINFPQLRMEVRRIGRLRRTNRFKSAFPTLAGKVAGTLHEFQKARLTGLSNPHRNLPSVPGTSSSNVFSMGGNLLYLTVGFCLYIRPGMYRSWTPLRRAHTMVSFARCEDATSSNKIG